MSELEYYPVGKKKSLRIGFATSRDPNLLVEELKQRTIEVLTVADLSTDSETIKNAYQNVALENKKIVKQSREYFWKKVFGDETPLPEEEFDAIEKYAGSIGKEFDITDDDITKAIKKSDE